MTFELTEISEDDEDPRWFSKSFRHRRYPQTENEIAENEKMWAEENADKLRLMSP